MRARARAPSRRRILPGERPAVANLARARRRRPIRCGASPISRRRLSPRSRRRSSLARFRRLLGLGLLLGSYSGPVLVSLMSGDGKSAPETRDVGGRRRSNLGRLIMIRESIYCHLVVGETRRAAKHWARQLRCFQFSPRASDSGHNKATVRSPSWSLVGHSNERGARGQAGCICRRRRRRRTLFQGATRLAQSARSHLRRPIYLAERAVFLMSSPAR